MYDSLEAHIMDHMTVQCCVLFQRSFVCYFLMTSFGYAMMFGPHRTCLLVFSFEICLENRHQANQENC